MSDLSDFKRVVYEPEVAKLKARIAELQEQLEAAHAQVGSLEGLYEQTKERVSDLESRIAQCYRGESFDLLWEALDKPLDAYPASNPVGRIIGDTMYWTDGEGVEHSGPSPASDDLVVKDMADREIARIPGRSVGHRDPGSAESPTPLARPGGSSPAKRPM